MLGRSEYKQLDAVEMARMVREKQISPLELLEAALRETELVNPDLNAVVIHDDELARAAAKTVSTSLPLAGVPYLAKDINVHVRGLPLKHACRFFDSVEVSAADSLLTKRWRDAGLVVFGRTNTPEFATDFGCEPEYYGPARNPWNMDLTTGGSSGGAAAAVASGMVPVAHASDSGGSIRVPAACCGAFGFKPTSGLVATGSKYDPLVNGLNCDHAISWTVRDSAALLDVTAGPGTGAPRVCHNKGENFLKRLEEVPENLKIGFVAPSPTGIEPATEILACLEATAKLLEEMGHKIEPWNWPADCDACDLAAVFWANEIAAIVEDHAQSIGRQPRKNELGPVIHWAIDQARNTNSVDVAHAKARLNELRWSMAEAMSGIDVILSPIVAEPPVTTGIFTKLVNKDVAAWTERAWRFAPYPEIFNVTGQPAMSVPLFQGKEGLPIGIHFAGNVGQDLKLLQLARQLELALPWRGRRPPQSNS